MLTCYKLNQNNFGSEALIESPVGKTVFFQTEIFGDNSGDVVQKVTMWDQVQLPSDWPPQLQIPTFPKLVFGSSKEAQRSSRLRSNEPTATSQQPSIRLHFRRRIDSLFIFKCSGYSVGVTGFHPKQSSKSWERFCASNEEEDQFLLAKNSILTSIVRAKSEANLQAVMETIINNTSDDNKQDEPEDIANLSDSSINDIDFDNDPYYNFDIFEP
ncbi:hypothetical protein E5676_scaffold204G00720 [Cucumis melo var. makuwa]|uniref:Uncharacterized protein n=1 Tax=Cucumis melo var. makuwa TaxID=1194695 RepID=A0A5D3D5S0_CUCMM|nr:hypothetical protein E5676_scaffold204G00720 [Cucumis melo var. makuwa]